MRALSLWQPWASLVIIGAKRFETRGWRLKQPGPLVIHAAKAMNAEVREFLQDPLFRDTLRRGGLDPDRLPYGAALGTVTVRGCCPTESVRDRLVGTDEYWFGNFSDGRFAIDLADPFAFSSPLPFKGAQGLFDFPDDLIKEGPNAWPVSP